MSDSGGQAKMGLGVLHGGNHGQTCFVCLGSRLLYRISSLQLSDVRVTVCTERFVAYKSSHCNG